MMELHYVAQAYITLEREYGDTDIKFVTDGEVIVDVVPDVRTRERGDHLRVESSNW